LLVIFGLATIPIFAAVGAAVDYSAANSSRTETQAAADESALEHDDIRLPRIRRL
jgi:Flp pilus assembly protein TadG